MIDILLALAAAASAPLPTSAPTSASTSAPATETAAPAESAPAAPVLTPSASRVAEWIAASGDNGALPYIVIDKQAARMFLFDREGKRIADAPVLIGIAPGDEATPGIGSKNLAEIGTAEKTTPAGRFLARYGLAAGRQQVLWVDYATSVAIHPIPSANPREKRRQRLLSPTSEDNRITFGCINVPKALYAKSIRPLFRRKGGYVYILPDTRPLEDVFPRLRTMPFVDR